MAWAKPKASTQARGYGTGHRQLRAKLAPKVAAGLIDCWRCGKNLRGHQWHLGHDDNDRTIYRGAECAACNLGAAARKGAGIAWANRRDQGPRSTLQW